MDEEDEDDDGHGGGDAPDVPNDQDSFPIQAIVSVPHTSPSAPPRQISGSVDPNKLAAKKEHDHIRLNPWLDIFAYPGWKLSTRQAGGNAEY